MKLIDIKSMERAELDGLLDAAESFLDPDGAVITPPHQQTMLNGKALALLFFEPSTRTRVSFELAAKRLGATVVRLGEEGSSLQKGETILDTCRNLAAMGVDGFVVRHSERDIPYVLAENLPHTIINAGNGSGEHPSQGLLDALTLRRAMGGEFQGAKVAILGDIIRSRVARSDAFIFSKLGAQVTLAGPSTMVPRANEDGWGDVRVTTSRDEAIAEADAVVVLRIQRERMSDARLDLDEYITTWGIDEEVLTHKMKDNVWIMHPGPVIRGVELSGAVADGPHSLIMAQVRCGVAMRQAILARGFAG